MNRYRIRRRTSLFDMSMSGIQPHEISVPWLSREILQFYHMAILVCIWHSTSSLTTCGHCPRETHVISDRSIFHSGTKWNVRSIILNLSLNLNLIFCREPAPVLPGEIADVRQAAAQDRLRSHYTEGGCQTPPTGEDLLETVGHRRCSETKSRRLQNQYLYIDKTCWWDVKLYPYQIV